MPTRQISDSESVRRSLSIDKRGRVQSAIPSYVLPVLFIMIYGIRHLTVSFDGISLVSTTVLESGILPRFLNAITDFCGLIVLLIFFRHPFLHANWRYLPWILLIVFWLGLLVISGGIGLVSGNIDLTALIVGMRVYLRVFIPFLIGMFLLGEDDIRWIWKAILVIGFVQSPLAYLQVLRGAGSADLVSGLMGMAGSGMLGSFQAVCVGILLARFLNDPKAQNAARLTRKVMILIGLCVILLVPLILADSKAAFLTQGIVVFAILRRQLLSFRGWVFFVTVGSVLLVGVLRYSDILSTITQTYVKGNPLTLYYEPSLLVESLLYPDSGGVNGRLQNFSEFNYLLTNSGDILWGYGPGLLNTSIIASETFFFVFYRDQVTGSLSFGSQILLETGYLGVLWWCIFFLRIFMGWSRAYRRLATMADGRYILDAFAGFFIVICFTLVYNMGLLVPVLYFPFMLVSGYVVRIAGAYE